MYSTTPYVTDIFFYCFISFDFQKIAAFSIVLLTDLVEPGLLYKHLCDLLIH